MTLYLVCYFLADIVDGVVTQFVDNIYVLIFVNVQYEKVLKFISNAKSEGATILYGGKRPQVKKILFSKSLQML